MSKPRRNAFKKNKEPNQKNPPAKFLMQLGDQVWPIERSVFFRPDRLKYVRKLVPQNGCVFCASEKAGLNLESLCLYKSQYSMIVLNKYPYNSGHLLVLPRRHCGDFLDLSESEFSDLHQTLKLAFKVMKINYEPMGANIGLNHGAVAGAGIPDHLHYHLVPRWSGDLNFFPLIADTKLVIESLEQSYARYEKTFLKLKNRGTRK